MATYNARAAYSSYPTIDSTFIETRERETQAGRLRAQTNRADDFTEYQTPIYAANVNAPVTASTNAAPSYVKNKTKKLTTEEKIEAKVKVSAANAWINGWALTWYLMIQLPFAILTTIGMGIVAAVYAAISYGKNAEGFTGYLVSGIESLAGYVGISFTEAAIDVASYWYGIEFDPILLFGTGFLTLFIFVSANIYMSYLVYNLIGIKPLSGKAGTIKKLLFILASAGTIIPILNLLPLTFLWTTVVWLRPN